MRCMMIVFGMIITGLVVAAGAPVTNQFTAGDPIVANDINANFQELADRNDVTQTAVTQTQGDVTTLQSDLAVLQGTVSSISNSGSSRQLVGFSSGTAAGDAGIKVFTELCDADFAGSGMCTSEEIVKTKSFANLPVISTSAWVLPVLAGSGNGVSSGAAVPTIELYSGLPSDSSENLTCSGWKNAGIFGLAVNNAVQFLTRDCSIASSVACCL